MVKNLSANAGDIQDADLIPGSDPLEEGMATHSSILAWRIPWTEEPGGYNPWGPKELDMAEQLTFSKLSYKLTTTLLFLQFTGLVS